MRPIRVGGVAGLPLAYTTGVVSRDSWFFSRADELSRAQARLAELAANRAQSVEVRRMARQLADNQKDLGFRVEWTAKQQSLELDRSPGAQATHQRVAALDGEAFDRAFLTTTLDWQRRQLALWDDLIETASDAALAQFAFETLPLLRADHAIAARQLQRM